MLLVVVSTAVLLGVVADYGDADSAACKAACAPNAIRICYDGVAVCAGPDGAIEARQVMP